MADKSQGQIAYDAYLEKVSSRDPMTNAPLPPWNALLPPVKAGWEAAAKAIAWDNRPIAGEVPQNTPVSKPVAPMEQPKRATPQPNVYSPPGSTKPAEIPHNPAYGPEKPKSF